MEEPPRNILIWQAAVHGNIDRVRSELDKGAHIDTLGPDGGTPLQSTIRKSIRRSELFGMQPTNQMVEFLMAND